MTDLKNSTAKRGKQFDYEHVFLKDPIYSKYKISEYPLNNLLNLVFYHPEDSTCNRTNTLDSFCPICNEKTTLLSKESDLQEVKNTHVSFSLEPNGTRSKFTSQDHLQKKGTFTRTFFCPRKKHDPSHNHIFVFKVEGEYIIKIGQSPSIADLSRVDIEKYRSFNKEIYLELNRAIGLESHGIGIGSFVYLRRILEKHIVQPKLNGLSPSELISLDFKNKIKLVKDDLPNFLVENPKIYSVLSKGIHELTEDECKTYFPVLRTAIEIILDEQIEQIERNKKRAEVQKHLGNIS